MYQFISELLAILLSFFLTVKMIKRNYPQTMKQKSKRNGIIKKTILIVSSDTIDANEFMPHVHMYHQIKLMPRLTGCRQDSSDKHVRKKTYCVVLFFSF